MQFLVFEDDLVSRLYPITIGRPAYAITCASYRLIDWVGMLARELGARAYGVVRPHLAEHQRLDYPPIAGGADTGLRDGIRARLADGTLPRVTGRAWAGKGDGSHQCACCDGLITRMDSEYKPQADPTLHAHSTCFTVWLAESIALNGLERRLR